MSKFKGQSVYKTPEGLIYTGAIYRHYKGELYRVIKFAYDHENGLCNIIYHRCNEKGVFKSIRDRIIDTETGQTIEEVIIKQPFIRPANQWFNMKGEKTPRFVFVKFV